MAADGDLVPIVIQGVAKSKSASAIGVGDSVTPYAYNDSASPSRVETATADTDPIVGRCLTVTPEANQVIDVLVDIAGPGIVASLA